MFVDRAVRAIFQARGRSRMLGEPCKIFRRSGIDLSRKNARESISRRRRRIARGK